MRAAASNSDIRRLEALLARAEDRAAWIQDICVALGEFERFDEFLDFIIDRIRLIMEAESARVYIVSDDRGHLWCPPCAGSDERSHRIPMGVGITGAVAQTGRPLNLRDASLDRRFEPELEGVGVSKVRSLLCQPMRDRDGRVVGVVQVVNKRSGHFSVDDEFLLAATANTAAVVIQNRSLYYETVKTGQDLSALQAKVDERARRLDMLHGIHAQLVGASEPEEVLRSVAHSVGDMIQSFACAVTLTEGGHLSEFAFSRRKAEQPLSECARTWGSEVRARAMETREPVLFAADPVGDDANGSNCVDPRDQLRSIIAVPLVAGGDVIGCIELVNRCRAPDDDNAGAYTPEDLMLLELAAGDIATAVERSLEARRRELQGRLAAIGHMLSGVVHDLRTPITIANGYLQIIAKSDDPERRKALAEKVMAQFEHISEMTRELLAYARGETSLYVRSVHLSVLAGELGQMLAHEFTDSNVEVEVVTDVRGEVRVDDGKLKRVIFNLARNAREAMRDGGHFGVTFQREDDVLVIRVSDTGQGIPPEIRSTLFDAFVSASKEGGSGLGLAIVKKLVEEHGGTIAFDTSAGAGTTFTVRIPDAFRS